MGLTINDSSRCELAVDNGGVSGCFQPVAATPEVCSAAIAACLRIEHEGQLLTQGDIDWRVKKAVIRDDD